MSPILLTLTVEEIYAYSNTHEQAHLYYTAFPDPVCLSFSPCGTDLE